LPLLCEVTCKLIGLDALLPGFGFTTVIAYIPAVASEPLAVSCVEEVNVVVSTPPANSTSAPLTKSLPVMVIEKPPAVTDIGETLAITGVGFHSVTVLWPAALDSAALSAWMVTLFGLGRVAGAVYTPVALIVPVAARPPVTPFTCQVTLVFEAPVTVAVNGCGSPTRTVAGFGETVTETFGGTGGGAPGAADPEPDVKPAQFA
jgi:hypothetical protein